jgi:resuscitation-promoting factor RpfB
MLKPERFILPFSSIIAALTGLLFLLLLSSCNSIPTTQTTVPVSIQADGKSLDVNVPVGSTVQIAIDKSGIKLSNLDRMDPPGLTVITSGLTITVIRVREAFDVTETIVPFERQTVKNESLPEGQTMLVQAGVNGSQQITYRIVYENDKEVSRSIFKTEVVSEAKPEIVMVGVQTPFTSVEIPGRLVYLTAGNAWIMEGTTGTRRPVITSGDLDGHIFSLSPDGKWLLFSRKASSTAKNQINSLWVVSLNKDIAKPMDLKVSNVVHFAAWVPGSSFTITYSTVEPRATAPGWQANNDLELLTFTSEGVTLKREEILKPNSGGIYGWWGMTFAWSPDGAELAYARPDSIGLVDFEKKELVPLLNITPFQTKGDWAWVPDLGWSDDHRILYTETHAPKTGFSSEEQSPLFNLSALILHRSEPVTLISQTGMFAYPSPSPLIDSKRFSVAYLQAIFPESSDTSRYRLWMMAQDGANQTSIFPPEGSTGLDPQPIIWSPREDSGIQYLAITYQGNLWLIDPVNNKSQQITGDGTIKRVDWK